MYNTLDSKHNLDPEIQFPSQPVDSRSLKSLLALFEEPHSSIPISASSDSFNSDGSKYTITKGEGTKEQQKEQFQKQLALKLKNRREEQQREMEQRQREKEREYQRAQYQKYKEIQQLREQSNKSTIQQIKIDKRKSIEPSFGTTPNNSVQSLSTSGNEVSNTSTGSPLPYKKPLPQQPSIPTLSHQNQPQPSQTEISPLKQKISTTTGLNITMEDLIKALKEEKINHQQTIYLLKSLQEENKKQHQELQQWKSKFYKVSTKLQKVNVILTHFQGIMLEDRDQIITTPPQTSSSLQQSASSISPISTSLSNSPLMAGISPIGGSSGTGPSSSLPGQTNNYNYSGTQSSSSSWKPGGLLNQFSNLTKLGNGASGERIRATTLTNSMIRSAHQQNGTLDQNILLQHSTSQNKEMTITNGTEGLNLTEEEYLGLLERRKVIALQILKTEKEYASNLAIIVGEFLQPLKAESIQSSNPFITSVDVKQLFGDVEVILGSNKILIEDLENSIPLSQSIGMGDVFLKVCDYFKLYSPYVKNYWTSITVLNNLKRTNHRFQTFIKEAEAILDGSNFGDLGSLLLLPVTRIGTYTNMLTELFYSTPHSHPDYEPFKNSVYKMKSIVDYVKDKTREHENQNKVRMIQDSMSGKFKNLNLPHRRYVREGELFEVTNNKQSSTPYYCFLFNDILIISTKKSSSNSTTAQYQFKKEIKLVDADVTFLSDVDDKPIFQITFTSHSDQEGSHSSGNTLSNNQLLDQVLQGIASGSSITSISTSFGGEESKDSIILLADSIRDREDWVYSLQQNITNIKKIQENRKQEEVILDFGKGEIDFQNSEIQLCELLGSGGSGCLVHRCTVDGFTCAVKILKLKNTQTFLIDQFVSEINLMTQFNHNNIAKYLGHRLTHNPDRLWLFIEYYPFSLKDIISKRTTPFPASEVIWMALEIAKGLDFLHSQKPPIIHRDLKPGNIMCSLDEKNRVNNIRVCDFDTSKALKDGVTLKTCIGTPCYMAAEVLDVTSESSEGYTLKADIWSFAMLVFEIISLLPPYHQFPHLNSIEMILKGTPPPLPSNVSPQLQPLIEYLTHCIDLNPNKRPSSSTLVSKLTKILKNSGKYNPSSSNDQ